MTDLFTVADLETKQKIVGLILPEKVVFENKQYRTNIENGLIPLLFNTSTAL